MSKGYTFQKPDHQVPSREKVVLFGNEQDPAIQATKKRIENTGRKVEIELRPAHDTGLGICGEHMCSCTEPCKSLHYQPKGK